MDLVSLLVLGTLAVTGLVTPTEALSGFSNPAVITVWAMFILSEGLTKTGIAQLIGQFVLKFSGSSEVRVIIVIMVTAGTLSAFMNNIGVAALMLPVVIGISKDTKISPSRLLMPLAYGTLLGGLTTLVGTPPNLLVSEALAEADAEPFGLAKLESFALFDYTPIGVFVMTGGILFIAFIGRHILPKTNFAQENKGHVKSDLRKAYGLMDRIYMMNLPDDSFLVGKTLEQSRIGPALGLNVLALIRSDENVLAPPANTVFRSGDRLMVEGRLDSYNELQGWQELIVNPKQGELEDIVSEDIELIQLRIAPESEMVGLSLAEAHFRQRFGTMVLVVRRGGRAGSKLSSSSELMAGDWLLIQGARRQLEELKEDSNFDKFEAALEMDQARLDYLKGTLFEMEVPEGVSLVGKTLADSRLGDAFDLRVLGIDREGGRILMPGPDVRLLVGDKLMILGRLENLKLLQSLQDLKIESKAKPDLKALESKKTSLVEAVLVPRSKLVGKTPLELKLRERYGVHLIAVWRNGRSIRSNLRDLPLELGDGLLFFGDREKMELLHADEDFLVLNPEGSDAQEQFKRDKAPVSAIIMALVIIPVFLDLLPISISAVCGAALMVLFRCLKMDEAYKAIDWKSVFLIAGMLPLGTALQTSGAANFLAEGLLSVTEGFGMLAVLMGLYLITALATTIIPTAALVVLMAPIVLKTCAEMDMSPHAAMMAIAMAASASFTSPISHPANVLVMGPGGYRFIDYVKLGVPLALTVFVIVMIVLPFFWPLALAVQ